MGAIRHAEARADHQGRVYSAGIVRRPFALQACERRAYQEAKAIYRGGVVEKGVVEDLRAEHNVAPFKDRMVNSIKTQPEGPVYGS